jgi:hypothetical protein
MGFPTTDWPTSLDPVQDRTDGVDIMLANDFDYQDNQTRQIQKWLGITGELIGAGVANAGPGGLVSPKADGSEAFRLAARNAFTSGTLLTLGDDYGVAYQEKFRVNFAGLVWSAGGGDFSSGVLDIPQGGSLPGAGTVGRLFYKTGADEGLYNYGSGGWSLSGGGIGAGSYLEMGVNHTHIQPATPTDEVIGQGVFDGSYVLPGTCYFRIMLTPLLTVAGNTTVRLYDVGAKGTPATPRLVSTLQTTTTGGPQVLEQALTVVAAAPGTNEILDTSRMYEIVIIQSSTAGDWVYTGSTGLEVR